MSKKIVVTGASGLIGKQLCRSLLFRGDRVTVFTRDIASARNILGCKMDYVKWNYNNPSEWQESLKDHSAVIHLAGANLFGKRWTNDYKKLIMESREVSTKNLVEAIKNFGSNEMTFISSSGVGYYGSAGENILTEDSPAGNDFLAQVCKAWEYQVERASEFGLRTAMLRQGIVLSNKGGALTKFIPPFKFFIGGGLGNGKQWFPWIHIDDIVAIYSFILDHENISGPVNAVSPQTIRMSEFAKSLGKILKRPSIFNVPELALRILIGEAASTIVSSQRVVPKKLMNHGFKFKFESLEEALQDLLKTKRA